ncbi:hypothetical protein [Blautia sp. MSJ-36]|uniref:hypothetical protein n=1 Tax=Blautia sp. MSJ-36 TaxID=2841530 RepID=UPI001C101398|nr:hypothetical protein [Blautia sp. MSJ-36]MBU5446314.1 hypothetical protein [Blautia sp. MSJ-36]
MRKGAFDISKVFIADEGYVYPEWISENYVMDRWGQDGHVCLRLFRVYRISEKVLEEWDWGFAEKHFGCSKDEFDWKKYEWYEAQLVEIFYDEPECWKMGSGRKE